MYSVYLTNFDGREVYRSDVLPVVMIEAFQTGFECYIMKDNELILTYSPIRGWGK